MEEHANDSSERQAHELELMSYLQSYKEVHLAIRIFFYSTLPLSYYTQFEIRYNEFLKQQWHTIFIISYDYYAPLSFLS